jgi:electron transport complex protein RnfE
MRIQRVYTDQPLSPGGEITLGGLRELIGQGTLFDQAHLMFGEAARGLTLRIEEFPGMLIAILPPGAFIGLGLLIMVKNLIDKRVALRAAAQDTTDEGAEGVTT